MGAISYVIGASAGGVRVFTATSSQGLAWMHEGLHWASGARLPVVMVNVNRPIAAPWNLTSDQSDSLAQRDTGWIQLYCESNQEVLDTVIQAYRIAESVSLPVMVCLDGVYLSYVAESIAIPDMQQVDAYLPPFHPTYASGKLGPSRYKMFDTAPPLAGGYSMDDWFESRYVLHKLHGAVLDAALEANREFETVFGRTYPPLEEYATDDAEVIVLSTGSAVGTCRHVVKQLRAQGEKVGLIKLKLFRPFPRDLVRKALAGKKKVAVIERDMFPGQGGIFCQELRAALSGQPHMPVYGFVSGLGGNDITVRLIEKAVEYTIGHPPTEDVIWLGLPEKKESDGQGSNAIKIR